MMEFIGLIAGLITMSAQIPQIVQSLKTKSTHDVSLGLYITLFIGILFWIVYGYYNSFTVFIMNVVLEISISVMIFLKLKYGMKPK